MKPVWDEKEENKKKFKEVLLEAGEYTGRVKKVEWVQSPYMVNQYNPNGDCLSVWVDVKMEDGDTKRLFDRISVTNPTRLNMLRTAANLKPVKKNENFDESQIMNKEVDIEVDEYTSKAGKVSNIIKEYFPATPSQKRESMESSVDTPF